MRDFESIKSKSIQKEKREIRFDSESVDLKKNTKYEVVLIILSFELDVKTGYGK